MYDDIVEHCVFDAISLDWTQDISKIHTQTGGKIGLQGNLDPCYIYAPQERLVEKINEMLDTAPPTKFVANLGHGILPDHDPMQLKLFVDTVHEYQIKK